MCSALSASYISHLVPTLRRGKVTSTLGVSKTKCLRSRALKGLSPRAGRGMPCDEPHGSVSQWTNRALQVTVRWFTLGLARI